MVPGSGVGWEEEEKEDGKWGLLGPCKDLEFSLRWESLGDISQRSRWFVVCFTGFLVVMEMSLLRDKCEDRWKTVVAGTMMAKKRKSV